MTLQKQIENTLNFLISKFYLENNITQAGTVENIKNKFNDVVTSANEEKLAPSKKNFSEFILSLKDCVKAIENSADRRLVRSLLSMTFMIRREANKQKSYLNVLNLNVNELNSHPEFSKARFITDNKKITLSYPRKK